MGFYRKRPVIIEAIQYTGSSESLIEVAKFVGDDYIGSAPDGQLYIATLEGEHVTSVGDWIVEGVMGEHYPVKPGIFAETYEPAPRKVDKL